MYLQIGLLLSSTSLCWCYFSKPEGWNFLNLHCRDNDNSPAEWWFVYKPPGIATSYGNSGRNFWYLSSEETSPKWVHSDLTISSVGMLYHTMAPMSKLTYMDHLAYLVFAENEDSSTHAIIMADALGALYIGHNVPDLVRVNSKRANFPEPAIGDGHMMFCMSITLNAANELAGLLRSTGARVLREQLPDSLRTMLPKWMFVGKNLDDVPWMKWGDNQLSFHTMPDGLKGLFLVKRPGQDSCLYDEFAKKNKLILDVYTPNQKTYNQENICYKDYGVRKINSISLKSKEEVEYVDNSTDKSRFAVSTAARWQRQGAVPEQYWACLGTLERQDESQKGGVLICIENIVVWTAFDNLKVSEPKC